MRTRIQGYLTVLTIGLIAVAATQASWAAEPRRIAVFDFELDDKSGGAGIIAKDAIDIENLRESTAEARRMLLASGHYIVVDTGGIAGDVASAGGIQGCNGCEGALAKRLGADQSMVGVVTRVNRTEFTLQILVRDAATGTVVSNDFTGLRMGANYAWPRGVKWLMTNKILATQQAR